VLWCYGWGWGWGGGLGGYLGWVGWRWDCDWVGLGPSGGFWGYGASGFNEKARDDRNDKYQLRYIHIYALFFAVLRKRPSFLYAYLQEKGQLGMYRINSRLSRTTRLATTATPWYQQTQPHPSIAVTKH
jgi:hypothetical protein